MASAHLIGMMLLFQELASAATPLPFDVLSDTVDPFNPPLLLNPRWGLQVTSDNAGRLPVVGHDCRLNGGRITNADAWTTGQAPCTSQPVHTTEASICGGHVNWFPIAYEGHLCWQDHHGGLFGDDDYNFRVLRPDHALQTMVSPAWILAEFDSDETVDHFDALPWWHRFHDLVDAEGPHGSSAVQSEICGKRAYVIGLVGFDTMHGGHSELHPVYSIAIHTNDAPADDTWVFFVRNWGDQGGCAHGDYQLDSPNPISLFFPRTGVTGVTFANGSLLASNSSPIRVSHQLIKGRGLQLSIPLPSPDRHTWVAGEVHLAWVEPARAPLPAFEQRLALMCTWNGCWPAGERGPPIKVKADEDEDEDWGLPFALTQHEIRALKRAIAKLDDRRRADAMRRFKAARAMDLSLLGITRPVSTLELAGARPKLGEAILPPVLSGPPSVRIVKDAPSKQERQLQALCDVLGGRIADTKLCAHVEHLSAVSDAGPR
jgi:hypothetical protein